MFRQFKFEVQQVLMAEEETMEALNENPVSLTETESESIYRVAHVIVWVRYKEGPQDDYPVWENIYLIKAKDDDDAWEKAERQGKEYPSPDEGLTFDGRDAEWVYGGVRKMHSFMESAFIRVAIDEFLDDVVELTWNQFIVPDKASLDELIAGEPVNVNYDK